MRKLRVLLLGVIGLVLGSPELAIGMTIRYEAVDLPDSVPGEDLWQYHYSVSGASLLSGQGFDVYFALSDGFLFGDLVAPQSAPSSDWDVLAIQPDAGLAADGLFDVVALVDDPSPGAEFLSTFIWRGTGTPGSQPFEVFDEQLVVTESGTTTPVPEPATIGLVLMAVIGFGIRLRP